MLIGFGVVASRADDEVADDTDDDVNGRWYFCDDGIDTDMGWCHCESLWLLRHSAPVQDSQHKVYIYKNT